MIEGLSKNKMWLVTNTACKLSEQNSNCQCGSYRRTVAFLNTGAVLVNADDCDNIHLHYLQT